MNIFVGPLLFYCSNLLYCSFIITDYCWILINPQFDAPACGFPKMYSRERVKPCFFPEYFIESHIFPEYFIEITQVVQKI